MDELTPDNMACKCTELQKAASFLVTNIRLGVIGLMLVVILMSYLGGGWA